MPSQITYFKRYRMEMDLLSPLPSALLPDGYTFLAWDDALVETHAEVKYHCFKSELDGVVFPNLSNRIGCLRLMREISGKPGFHRASTWLIAHSPLAPYGRGAASEGRTFVATIQGIADRTIGGIQNVGVVPEHRGKRLGLALVLRALHGFRDAGCKRATLEVTAQNEPAVRLYRQIGFRFRKTLYRMVEPATYPLEPLGDPEWVV